MLAYKLTGFVPDFQEQCMMTVANIYTSKEQAQNAFAMMKNEIIGTLQEDTDSMECFYTTENQYYGTSRVIASCEISMMCDTKQRTHIEMLMCFSGFSRSSLRASEAHFDTNNVMYKIAQFTITAEEVNL